MRRLLFFALLALIVSASPTHCQTASDSIQYVIMDDYVRDFLIADWDAHAADPMILERAYCLSYQRDFWADGRAYRITQIAKAETVRATNSSIQYICPTGAGHADLHVHPPQTCAGETGPCWAGGPYAYQCLASAQDQYTLEHFGQPFAMIQCSREAVITFWPRK